MKSLQEILNIELPIIQGGMANIANGEFAAACSNAGALGIIAAGGIKEAEDLRREIRICRSLTDKPFGVNLMLMNPCVPEMAKIIVEEKVPVVTTGAGSPATYIKMWKDAGIKVFPVVASTLLAKRLAPLGVDGIIAEGTESGGHVGEMTTMSLIPQVIDVVDIPVIAAGGIADSRQLAAALSLGSCGVQVGTVLLASKECPIHENYKMALTKAKDSDTTVTGRSVGGPVRVLKNKMARNYLILEKQGVSIEELEMLTLGSLKKAVIDGDVENGSLMAGQSAGLIKEIRSVKEILTSLYVDGLKDLEKTINIWKTSIFIDA